MAVRDDMIRRAFPNGAQMPGPISGYGGGTFNMDGTQATPQAPAGMFGARKKRSGLRQAAGYFADFAAGLAGREGPYAAMLQRERQSADQEAQYQRQRADAYADWQKKQEWERANPTPKTNDTVADYEFIRQNLGDELARKFLENKANPPLWQRGPDGQFYPVAPTQMPTAPVGKLTPLGDGAGNGVGGFR